MSIYEQLTGVVDDIKDFRKRGGFTPQLHGALGQIGEAASYFLSPRGRQTALNVAEVVDMMNPVSETLDAMEMAGEGDYLGAGVNVAGVAAPAAIVAKYGPQTALAAGKAIQETLTGTGDSLGQIGADVYETFIQRMNQPGPMPTVGSNFGNIGHNQGPSLEPDEIIPPARPRFISEYSASLDAAEKLPQARGTFDQMRKMMLDRGAKEDELEWSGFDSAFSNQGKVTKQGIIDYLRDNAGENMLERHINQVEGIIDEDAFKSSDELVDRFVEQNLEEETNYYLNERRQEDLEYNAQDYNLFKPDEITGDNANYLIKAYQNGEIDFNPSKIPEDKYVYFDKGNSMTDDNIRLLDEDEALDIIFDEDTAREMAAESLEEYGHQLDIVELRERLGLGGTADVGESGVEFAEYFTPGAKNYSENRYSYSPTDPNKVRYGQSFEGAHHGESDIMVHTRTGEFPLFRESGAVHHVGEIQSDWAQQLRRYKERIDPDYRAKTFEETKAISEGERASDVLAKMADKAREALRYAESFDDVNTPHIGINADLYEYIEGKKPIATADPRDSVLTNYDFNRYDILKFLMDPSVNNKYAKEFREELYNHNETNRFAARLTPEMDGKSRKEIYDQAKFTKDKAIQITRKDMKEGGPLIESTNKWVDFALRRELVDAVGTGNEYMTISNPDMVRDMTMGQAHGQSEFYGKIVPQRLKKLLRTFDKKANLEEIEIQTGDGVKKVLGVRLTDDLVRKIADKGMPIFSVPVGAGVLGALQSQNQEERAF